MQLHISVSGTIKIVHELPQGTSPWATLDDINALGESIVSQLSDKIAAASTATDAAISRVQSDVTDLQAKVAELQAIVDAGGASQADLDALDALKSKLDGLDPVSPVTLPPDQGGGTTTTI